MRPLTCCIVCPPLTIRSATLSKKSIILSAGAAYGEQISDCHYNCLGNRRAKQHLRPKQDWRVAEHYDRGRRIFLLIYARRVGKVLWRTRWPPSLQTQRSGCGSRHPYDHWESVEKRCDKGGKKAAIGAGEKVGKNPVKWWCKKGLTKFNKYCEKGSQTDQNGSQK